MEKQNVQFVNTKFDISNTSEPQEIAAKVWGTGREKILMLHGWLDNAATFDDLVPELLKTESMDDCCCIAIDLPGHGKSYHRGSETYYFTDYVADVLSVIQVILSGGEYFGSQITLCGHSLGGGIAMVIAGLIPDQIKRLILIEALGPYASHSWDYPSVLKDALTINKKKKQRTTSRVFTDLVSAARRRSEANILGHLGIDAALTLAKRGTSSLKEVDDTTPNSKGKEKADMDGVVWTLDNHVKMASLMRLSEGSVRAFIRKIECPVFFIVASDGMFKKGGAKPETFTRVTGRLTMYTIFIVVWAVYLIPIIGDRPSVLAFLKKVQQGVDMCRRVQAFNNLDCFIASGGGHHPHLGKKSGVPREVATAISKWTVDTIRKEESLSIGNVSRINSKENEDKHWYRMRNIIRFIVCIVVGSLVYLWLL